MLRQRRALSQYRLGHSWLPLDKPFTPDAYHDEYQARLREIIENKIAGKEIVAVPDERPNNVIDLMEALKASVEQVGLDNPKTSRKRKKA